MVELQADQLTKMEEMLERLIEMGTSLGFSILKALLIFIIGRFLISLLNKLVKKILFKRNVEPSIRTFTASLVNITLTVLLIIAIVGALGVETTSFAALLASAGLAVGMALSGQLSNFAGGLIVLLFKPYRVGDYVEAPSVSGTVKEIQIFHTVLTTADGKQVFVPNGAMSNNAVTNYNVPTRRVEWIIGVDYGTDIAHVKRLIDTILAKDARILADPAPFLQLHALAASSVNIVIRVWVNAPDYWSVYFETNRLIYDIFNAEGISFPFPQLTLHRAE